MEALKGGKNVSLQIIHELFLLAPFVHLQHKYDAILFSDV